MNESEYNNDTLLPTIKNNATTNIENINCNDRFEYSLLNFLPQDNTSRDKIMMKEDDQTSSGGNSSNSNIKTTVSTVNILSAQQCILSPRDRSNPLDTFRKMHNINNENRNLEDKRFRMEIGHEDIGEIFKESYFDEDDKGLLSNHDIYSESDLSTSTFSSHLCQSVDTVNSTHKVDSRYKNVTTNNSLMNDKACTYLEKQSDMNLGVGSFDFEPERPALSISDLQVEHENNEILKKTGTKCEELEESFNFEASSTSATVSTSISTSFPCLNCKPSLPSFFSFVKTPISFDRKNSIDTLNSCDISYDCFNEEADEGEEDATLQNTIYNNRLTKKDINIERKPCGYESIFPYEDIEAENLVKRSSVNINQTNLKEPILQHLQQQEYENVDNKNDRRCKKKFLEVKVNYTSAEIKDLLDKDNVNDKCCVKVGAIKSDFASSHLRRSRSFSLLKCFQETSASSTMEKKQFCSPLSTTSSEKVRKPISLKPRTSDIKRIITTRIPPAKQNHDRSRFSPTKYSNLENMSGQKKNLEKDDQLSKGDTTVKDCLDLLTIPLIVRNSFSLENASMIDRRAWLEVEDKKHRYGKKLRLYHQEWYRLCQPNGTFWEWLDGPYQQQNIFHSNSKSNEVQSQSLPIESFLQHVSSGMIEVDNCSRLELELDTVHYITEEAERKKYEISIDAESKKLFYSHVFVEENCIDHAYSKLSQRNLKLHKVLNTTNENGDAFIFVLRNNHIYAAMKVVDASPRFHHSSFFAGECVEAAGMIVCKDGVLQRIYAHSGHYRPSDIHIAKILTFLEKNSIDLSTVEFDMQLVLKVARCRDDSMKPLKRKIDTLYLWTANMALHFVTRRIYFASSGLQEQIQRFSF